MAAFKFDINYPGISVYKALTNKELSEEEKAEIIAEAIESISREFPNLKNVTTKQDLSETELKLTKEIETVRKEIKELDVKIEQVRGDLRKEIEQVRGDLTKEIEQVRADLSKDIRNLDIKIEQVRGDLSKEIEQVRGDLTKEIAQVKVDLIKEIDKSKVETIKWVSIMMIGQVFTIAGIVAGIFKVFMN